MRLTRLELVWLDNRDFPDLDALLGRVGHGGELRLGNGLRRHLAIALAVLCILMA